MDTASTLYRLGLSYHAHGTLKRGREHVATFFRADRLSATLRESILAAFPDAFFVGSSPEYAPEIRHVNVCIPTAAERKRRLARQRPEICYTP